MTSVPFRDHSYVRFISERTGETLYELKMVNRSVIGWGTHYRPNEFAARLARDGQTVVLLGTLRDRIGPVVRFAHCLEITAGFRVEAERLPDDYDFSWKRDHS